MILSCSACGTRFLVPDQALRPNGRRVKCGKCGATWTAPAPANGPTPAELEAIVPPVAELRPPAADHPKLEAHAAPLNGDSVPSRPARPKVVNLPTVTSAEPRQSDLMGWLILAASILIVIAAVYLGRDRIVALLPAAQPYYAAIGLDVALPERLSVRDVATKQVREGEGQALEVSGRIANESKYPRPAPRLRIALLNDRREQIFEFTFTPEAAEVPPRGEIPFATKLSRPPAEAKHLDVTLVPGSAQAGSN